MRTTSNSVVYHDMLIRVNSNTMMYMTQIYDSGTALTVASDKTLKNIRFFKDGINISDTKTLTLNTPVPVMGNINLNDSGTLTLEGDLHLASGAAFTASGDTVVINGDGHTIFLDGSLTLPSHTITIGSEGLSSLVIDGQGNDVTFGIESKFAVTGASGFDGGVLTLKNMTIYGLTSGNFCGSGTVILQNVVIVLPGIEDAWTVNQAGLRIQIQDDVAIIGNGTFTCCGDATTLEINSGSSLYVGLGATLDWKNRIGFIMSDSSSSLYLDGCTLKINSGLTNKGMLIQKGRVVFDNKVTINDSGDTAKYGLKLGDVDDYTKVVAVEVLAGARVEVNGYMYHNSSAG